MAKAPSKPDETEGFDLSGLRIADFESKSDSEEIRPDERAMTVAALSDYMVFFLQLTKLTVKVND